jgi:hypothetical protein
MTFHKAQQDSEAGPPTLQAEAKGAPSAAVPRKYMMKAIGGEGN